MLMTSIVLALIAALFEHFFGLGRPWREIIVVGIVILFVMGLLQLFGLMPLLRWP